MKRDFLNPLIGWLLMTSLLMILAWAVNRLTWMSERNAEILRHAARPYRTSKHQRYVTGPKVEAAIRAVGEQDPAEVIEIENEPLEEPAP